MKTTVLQVVSIMCLAALLAGVTALDAVADVRVNLNLGPPPIAVAQPPEVVLVPGSQVYFVPDVDYDVFYYNGYWWSPRGDRWYRARGYDGPWRVVGRRYIPAPVYRVPRDYRRMYYRERHVPYGEWRHRREHWREERGEHRGRGEERWEHRGR